MKTKLGTVALSTALISGLVLNGTAAQATDISDDVSSHPVQSSTPVAISTEPGAVPEESTPTANAASEFEAVSVPAESGAVSVAEEPLEVLDPEPPVEAPIAESAELEEAETSESTVEESASASEPEATTEAAEETSPSAEFSETPMDVTDEDADPRWAQIDALLPEGSEHWDEAQWEAFDQTEAGQEINRLLDELLAEDIVWDEEFDLSDEELAFWESINELIPEESFDWDESQWEEYFQSDNGLELIDLILPFMMEGIESDEDAAEIQAFLEEVFANDPELRAYYLEMYFGIQPETEIGGSGGPETEEEATPYESQSPTASAEIKPAGEVSKEPASEKQALTKAAGSTAPALANTGFDGFSAAGLGLLMALAGAAVVARGSRKSAKH